VQILTVGIAASSLPGIAFYPNPSDGRFTLVFDESAQLEIFNAFGSIVFNNSFDKGTHSLLLDLPEGVYLLKASNECWSRSMRVVIVE
jgi:hypothetical protein